ncbi:hypothetical protein C6N75_09730 [Streptomyces solincola]|uniref:PAS domain-containing protein n=1 Tax=Streptomyces solincola TaxID=2100817 RepID=A0A2S9PY69_9ACTN|nr:PAS domain-containing protein [Streptomyces solincola]PRH79355.1 hypothetical protein C6N75_09730 [Streptomyces solincola]
MEDMGDELAAGNTLVVAERSGIIRAVYGDAKRVLGWTAEALVGKPLVTLIPEDMRAAHLNGLAQFNATGEGPILNRTVEVQCVGRDGMARDIALTVYDGDVDPVIYGWIESRAGGA